MNTWKDGGSGHFYSWYLDLKPSTVTFYHPKTQTRIVEPSYVAAERKGPPSHGADPGGFVTLGRLLAVGKEALAYQNTPDVAVFSPFLLDRLSQDKLFQNAIVIHIDPPD